MLAKNQKQNNSETKDRYACCQPNDSETFMASHVFIRANHVSDRYLYSDPGVPFTFPFTLFSTYAPVVAGPKGFRGILFIFNVFPVLGDEGIYITTLSMLTPASRIMLCARWRIFVYPRSAFVLEFEYKNQFSVQRSRTNEQVR